MILDSKLRERIEAFYGVSLPSSVEGLECFSHPDLERHECNPQVTDCALCNNSLHRRCPVTCHINRFCWAVFAYRLGIGGPELEGAIDHNLSKSHDWLWSIVTERFDLLSSGEDPSIRDDFQLVIAFPVMEMTTKEEELPDVELISLSQAARVYGCTYCNIYSHVQRGNLKKYESGGVCLVEKAAVLDLRAKKR